MENNVYNINEAPTFEKVWFLFQEISQKFLENSQQLKETKELLKEASLETDKKFLETDKKFQETDKKFQETDKQFKATDKKIKELTNLFTTQWGKLIENLVEPSCVKLFQDRDIKIVESQQNVKSSIGDGMECDIMLVNSTEIVVIEVKTTFKPSMVDYFLERLAEFKHYFPRYKEYKVYGATAALKYESQSDKYAYRNGLFVLRSSGEGIIKITNDKKFKPQAY